MYANQYGAAAAYEKYGTAFPSAPTPTPIPVTPESVAIVAATGPLPSIDESRSLTEDYTLKIPSIITSEPIQTGQSLIRTGGIYSPTPAIPADYETVLLPHSYEDPLTGEVIKYTPSVYVAPKEKGGIPPSIGGGLAALIAIYLALKKR